MTKAKNKVLTDFSEEGAYDTIKKCKCWADAIEAATEGLEELMSRGYRVTSFFIEENIEGENTYNIEVKGSKMGGGIFLHGMKVKGLCQECDKEKNQNKLTEESHGRI